MGLRDQQLHKLQQQTFDVLIVGGGINGAVSAAALSARGAKVALIDGRDFAGFTSQQSSNLVWGGIKYMESFDYALVNDLCKSRNELLRAFPSTVQEIRFLTTIARQFRFHPLLMYLGTWIYWLLGRGKTRRPRLVSAKKIRRLEPLINTQNSRAAIEYSDAYLHDNDARFVWNFIFNAMENGCVACNYLKSSSARYEGNEWICHAIDNTSGQKLDIRARALINAAGAFVDQYNSVCDITTRHRHVFSKGIHLIVPQISRRKQVLAFFADDGRLFFAIPMAHRTCIGTTDTLVEDPCTSVTSEDRDFVLSNINARLRLKKPLKTTDVISERCGVRPLAVLRGAHTNTDFLQLSRRHVIEVDSKKKHVSIFGGKLTDCLNIGNQISQTIASFGVPLTEPEQRWYGEPESSLQRHYFTKARSLGLDEIIASDTGENLSQRLWRRYGKQALGMLEKIAQQPDLTEPLIDIAGVRLCELDHLAENEMIVKLEDFLRRRSKISLLVPREKLQQAQELRRACERLFGDQADIRYAEYFADNASP